MKRFLVCGICGKMGKIMAETIDGDDQCVLVGGVDVTDGDVCARVFKSFEEVDCEVDAVIDFSSPAALKSELEWAKTKHVPLVLAATGYTKEHIAEIEEAAKEVAVFRSANFSLGVNLLAKLVKEAAAALGEDFDIEIVEKHHNKKADAPSGTALMLAESANLAFAEKKNTVCGREGITGRRGNEIGIHAVRGGTIVGEHEVLFCGPDEIVTLAHSARSKKIFAAGALKAAKWICGKSAGLYKMDDLLDDITE